MGTVENRQKNGAVGKSVGRMAAVSAANVLLTDLSMALRLFSIVSIAPMPAEGRPGRGSEIMACGSVMTMRFGSHAGYRDSVYAVFPRTLLKAAELAHAMEDSG